MSRRQKAEADIETLRQCFPDYDRQALISVYAASNQNFERAYKSLQKMGTQTISNDRKLKFMRAIFDQLDPGLIKNLLVKWKWSVEGSLDDLLREEEMRCEREEAIRRQQEEMRRKREWEEQRKLQQQMEELRRRNLMIYNQSQFPRLPPDLIWHELNCRNFDPQSTREALYRHEQNRQMQELYQKNLRERHQLEQQLKQREEEEAKLGQMVDERLLQSWDDLIQNCNNWDDVLNLVTPENAEQKKESEKKIEEKEKEYQIAVACKMFPVLTPTEIEEIFVSNNWNLDKALKELDDKSFQKDKLRLIKLFPAISPQKVEELLMEVYPETEKAVTLLNDISHAVEQKGIQTTSLTQATALLNEAENRMRDWEATERDILEQRKIRQSEIDNMPPGAEKEFMKTIYEMKTQKEDAYINENRKRREEEVSLRRAQVLAETEKISALEKRHQELESKITPSTDTFEGKKNRRFLENRHRFDNKVQSKREQLKIDASMEEKAKKSLVATKMRENLGEEKFLVLQEAIGRAPGGVAKGFRRKDYQKLAKESEKKIENLAQQISTVAISPVPLRKSDTPSSSFENTRQQLNQQLQKQQPTPSQLPQQPATQQPQKTPQLSQQPQQIPKPPQQPQVQLAQQPSFPQPTQVQPTQILQPQIAHPQQVLQPQQPMQQFQQPYHQPQQYFNPFGAPATGPGSGGASTYQPPPGSVVQMTYHQLGNTGFTTYQPPGSGGVLTYQPPPGSGGVPGVNYQQPVQHPLQPTHMLPFQQSPSSFQQPPSSFQQPPSSFQQFQQPLHYQQQFHPQQQYQFQQPQSFSSTTHQSSPFSTSSLLYSTSSGPTSSK